MIRGITLRRFKRFADVTVPVSDHIVLAGPNNTGKTTVLQAVAAWSLAFNSWKQLNDFNSRRGGYTTAPISRESFAAVPLRSFDFLWRERQYGAFIEIELLHDGLGPVAMEFHYDTTEQIKVRPALSVKPDILKQLSFDATFVPAMSGLTPREAPYANIATIDALLAQSRPGDVLRNLLVIAHRDDAAWQRLTRAVQRMFNVDLQAPTQGAWIVAEYKAVGSNHLLDIASAGSGFQQVLMLLALLHTRPGRVLLMDEPDAHLHLFLQDTIYSELRSAAAQQNSQLIIATHSEVVINSVDARELCLMYGQPRLLANDAERAKLVGGLSGLSHSDLMMADAAQGILYVEDYTDLEILREYAKVLDHQPAIRLLSQRLMWKAMQAALPDGLGEFKPQQHWDMLKLVNPQLLAVELLDGDSKNKADERVSGAPDVLQRLRWQRYEIESYLLHPDLLSRFVERLVGAGAAVDSLRAEMLAVFQADYLANPSEPIALVASYLKREPASKTTIPGLLQAAGIHGFEKRRMHEIAALAKPEELDPEVRQKLDLICRAFGVDAAS
jgi:ABC-type transport system involved in cytochrome c biogenesis ATPase subunit